MRDSSRFQLGDGVRQLQSHSTQVSAEMLPEIKSYSDKALLLGLRLDGDKQPTSPNVRDCCASTVVTV